MHWRDPFAEFFHAHKGCLRAYYSYEREGHRPRWYPSYGFVLQFLQTAEANYASANVNILPEVGAAQQWIADAHPDTIAAAGVDEAGIAVGTGTTAEANANRDLVTKITHGVGVGQLSYGSMAFVSAAITGANVDLVFTRPFTNSSGADITVQEIGIFAGEATPAPTTATNALICRDLTGAITHANTTTRTGQYTWRTTV